MKQPSRTERRGQLARVEVSPLRDEALREAIAAPARAVGVTVQPALIERLVADAASERALRHAPAATALDAVRVRGRGRRATVDD